MNEHSLPGGAISGAVRIGDTVHRRPGARAGFVHELLGFFQRAGWPGAPRFLGLEGRAGGDKVRAWCGRSRDFITNGAGFPLSLLAYSHHAFPVSHFPHVVLCCHIQLFWSRGIYLAARWFSRGNVVGVRYYRIQKLEIFRE